MSSRNPPTQIPPRASAQRQRQTEDSTIVQHQPRRDAEDTIHGTLQPLSTLRHRPLSKERIFVIPMNDGTDLRVTERELSELPLDWQQYAQPLATPQAQKHPPEPETRKPIVKKRRRVKFHWLVFVGIGLFIMIIGWLTFSALSSWWSVQQDNWHYGRPRTFQTDQVVGHGDSQQHPSHFISMNLDRHVVIIECPGGDCTKVKVYQGLLLIGNGEDLAPVTLSFQRNAQTGRLDMIVHVLTSQFLFLNDGQKFIPPQQ